MRMKKPRPPVGVPTRETLLAFLATAGEGVGKREIAKAFGVKGADRPALKQLIHQLEDEGVLAKAGRKAFQRADLPPASGLFEIVDLDPDGELMARASGQDGLFGPLVRVAPAGARVRADGPAPGLGDRVIARTVQLDDGTYEARIIKRIGASAHRIVGVFHAADRGGRVEPADRKTKGALVIFAEDQGDAQDGDLVACRLLPHKGYGPKRAKITDVFGHADDPRAASILAIAAHNIPMGFAPEEEAEAEAAKPATLKGRTDLRDLPLVTIDPEDARDHDDAVCALPDDDPKNPGGWIVWVAIADVAHYVTPGSALDAGALKRGNSVYFPDRVVPMLPERLSADLCSLREGVERPCMAVAITIDAEGRKRSHRFVRGLMRSFARLTYQQAQAAFDGTPDDACGPLMDGILTPLWQAYQAMKRARDARDPLQIASTERRVKLSPEGEVTSIQVREQLESMKLIEEMMIGANVCAAETLEQKQTPLIYRVHDQPSQEKLASLADFLQTVDIKWAKGQPATPSRFNAVLRQARATENAEIVNEVVLRSQAQAIYSPDNIGHFGLTLHRYAHFTSPIRRYADLIVHRALIRALGLGGGGLTDAEAGRLDRIAEAITATERRAMAAERDATDRYVAAFLADKVGATFEARITGVTRFGLFVRLLESGADGLCPAARLGAEYWIHDEASHAMIGSETGGRYVLGQIVEVRLVEATPVSGGLLFDMLTRARPGKPPGKRSYGSKSPAKPPSRKPLKRRR
jgi:ribonuclease R